MKPKSLVFCWLLIMFAVRGATAHAQEYRRDPADALFDPNRVIKIEIRLDPKDWHALRISHPILDGDGAIAVKESAYIYFRGDVVIDGQLVKSVGVRKKGAFGSTVSTRPSLKIKFDEYVKNREFAGPDMLTLNNCVQDPTRAQQFLVYSFMREAGVPASRSNLARVRVNGEDLGIYANVESIRKPFIKRHFINSNGDLYEGQNSTDFTTNEFHRIIHKWGKDADNQKLRELVDVLQHPDQISLNRIEEMIDLDSFITFWASEVLIGVHDGYSANRNNFYVYRHPNSGKLFFLPWGADVAFRDPGFLPGTVPKSVKAQGQICKRLWELSEIRERYRAEMRRLLNTVWNEKKMLAELERIERLCQDDPTVNAGSVRLFSSRIIQFVETRRKEVQAELNAPAFDWPNVPSRTRVRSAEKGLPMKIEGSFTGFMVETFPTNLFENGSAKLEFSAGGKTHKMVTRSGATAVPKGPSFPHLNSIIQVVVADADELLWQLSFYVDPYWMTPGAMEVAPFVLGASLTQSHPKSPNARYKDLHGVLELDQASTKIGSKISGRFKLNTTAFEEEKKP